MKSESDTNNTASSDCPAATCSARALAAGWEVEKRSLYDEEGIEGWAWIEPDGTEHIEIGDWDKSPPWPDSAEESFIKQNKPLIL